MGSFYDGRNGEITTEYVHVNLTNVVITKERKRVKIS